MSRDASKARVKFPVTVVLKILGTSSSFAEDILLVPLQEKVFWVRTDAI